MKTIALIPLVATLLTSCLQSIPKEPAARAEWYRDKAEHLLEVRQAAQQIDAAAERELRETVCPSYQAFRDIAKSPELDGICAALLGPPTPPPIEETDAGVPASG